MLPRARGEGARGAIAAEAARGALDGDEVDVGVPDPERLAHQHRLSRALEVTPRRVDRLDRPDHEKRTEAPHLERRRWVRLPEANVQPGRDVVVRARIEDPKPAAERPVELEQGREREVRVGTGEDVERDIAPLLKGPKPATVTSSSEPYLTAQRSSDLSLAWGSRMAILGGYLADCSPAALDAFVAHVEDVPGDSSISVTAMGGAIGRTPDDAMAFSGRATPFDVSPDTAWSDPALDDANMDWIRRAMAIVEPDLLPGRYVNELSDAGPEVTRASYGDEKLARLRALKLAWDPSNVFHLNHNVAP